MDNYGNKRKKTNSEKFFFKKQISLYDGINHLFINSADLDLLECTKSTCLVILVSL